MPTVQVLTPDDVHRLIERLEPVRDRAMDDKRAVSALYAGVSPQHDARVTAFAKHFNVWNSLQLGFTFVSKHLLYHSWWEDVATASIPDRDKQIYATEFGNLLKLGFVQGVSSAVESSLRIFLRALDPVACKGGMAEFKSIYECLFKSKLATVSEAIALLDLLRLVRNTVHNNGVYFHPSGLDESITWKGNLYEFKQGKMTGFVTWEFMIDVADSLRALIRRVVEDPALLSVTPEIPDPASY